LIQGSEFCRALETVLFLCKRKSTTLQLPENCGTLCNKFSLIFTRPFQADTEDTLSIKPEVVISTDYGKKKILHGEPLQNKRMTSFFEKFLFRVKSFLSEKPAFFIFCPKNWPIIGSQYKGYYELLARDMVSILSDNLRGILNFSD